MAASNYAYIWDLLVGSGSSARQVVRMFYGVDNEAVEVVDGYAGVEDIAVRIVRAIQYGVHQSVLKEFLIEVLGLFETRPRQSISKEFYIYVGTQDRQSILYDFEVRSVPPGYITPWMYPRGSIVQDFTVDSLGLFDTRPRQTIEAEFDINVGTSDRQTIIHDFDITAALPGTIWRNPGSSIATEFEVNVV